MRLGNTNPRKEKKEECCTIRVRLHHSGMLYRPIPMALHPNTKCILDHFAEEWSVIDRKLTPNQALEIIVQLSIGRFTSAEIAETPTWTHSKGRRKPWEYICQRCRDKGWVRFRNEPDDCPDCDGGKKIKQKFRDDLEQIRSRLATGDPSE